MFDLVRTAVIKQFSYHRTSSFRLSFRTFSKLSVATILPPANEIWSKVMFFKSVCHSVQRACGFVYEVTSCVAARSHVPSGKSLSLVPLFLAGGLSVGSLSGGISVGRPPPGIRKAGAAHSSGMLSCLYNEFAKVNP